MTLKIGIDCWESVSEIRLENRFSGEFLTTHRGLIQWGLHLSMVTDETASSTHCVGTASHTWFGFGFWCPSLSPFHLGSPPSIV